MPDKIGDNKAIIKKEQEIAYEYSAEFKNSMPKTLTLLVPPLLVTAVQ